MKRACFLSLFLPLLILSGFIQSVQAEQKIHPIHKILAVDINSSINPATLDYLKSADKKAHRENFDLILVTMNTPGGLVTTTKEILTTIGESDIPYAVWIKPEGASATSAGAIIASGAHILLMSEGTNIGAATPVQMGKDIPKDMRNKAINDLVALVQSLAKTRGRNQALFGEMIKTAASYQAQEAVKNNLIDGIANTQRDLFTLLPKLKIHLKGQDFQINVVSQNIQKFEMTLGQKFLNIFANPSLAYVLLLVGAALLYLELQAPGGFIAGSVGAVCLLIAGIGFQILPINLGAIGLLVLSFVLFILEVYITSYGILSLAGLAAMIAGSLLLFKNDNAYLHLSHSLIFSAVGAVACFILFIVFVFLKDQKNVGTKKFNSMLGKRGEILEQLDKDGERYLYNVKVSGEVWKAESNQAYSVGDHVSVKEQINNSMKLKV